MTLSTPGLSGRPVTGRFSPRVRCPGCTREDPSCSLYWKTRAGLRICITAVVALVAIMTITGIASANDYMGGIPLQTVSNGVVSGGLYYSTYPGFSTSASQSFSLPKYKDIAWARLYVSVYCGHKQNNYEGTATVNLDVNGDGKDDILLATESMNVPYSYPGERGTGPVDLGHGNRVTSDYLFWYDVKDQITGERVGVNVKTAKASPSSSFDGRIKFIALVVAYNDGDRDKIYYWVNQGHDPMDFANDNGYTGETQFGTSQIVENEDAEYTATLSSLYMASEDGIYTFNGDELSGNGDPQGSYFGYEDWDVSDSIVLDEDSTLEYARSGSYFKLPLALLTVKFKEQPEGTLEVTSNPAGAQILLDGEELDKTTNQTLTEISAGEHTVQAILVDNEKYREPDEKSVTIKTGETTAVHFNIPQINGSVDIASDPDGAWIYLDGVNMSTRTDTLLENVIIGDHTVLLKKAGYSDVNTTITLEEDSTEEVALTFGEPDGNTTVTKGDNSTELQGYSGKSLSLYTHGFVHGGLAVADSSMYSNLLGKDMSVSYPLPVNLTTNATVKDARLYVYSTWSYDADTLTGKPANLQVDLDGEHLAREQVYSDRKGDGTYDYPVETHCYAIEGDQIADTPLSFTVSNVGEKPDKFAVYGVMLLVVYEDPAGQKTEYWIGEGSDAVYANPEFGVDSDDAVTRLTFPGTVNTSAISGAELYVVSTAASGDDNRIIFNDREWPDQLAGGSSGISIARLNVSAQVRQSGNRAGTGSVITNTKGDYMENRNLILVVTGTPDGENAIGMSTLGATGAANLTDETSDLTTDAVNETMLVTGPIEETLNQTGRQYSIRVLTNPPGAMISLDYRYSGKTTPDTIPGIPGGNHTISVELPGFDPVEERLFLSTNQTMSFDMATRGTSVFALEKISESLLDQEKYGGIYVTSSPDKTLIYIDGKKTSFTTPGLVYGLKPGKHTVQVKLAKTATAGNKNPLKFPIEKKEVWVDAGVVSTVAFMSYENPYLTTPVINSTVYNNAVFTINGMMQKYHISDEVNLQASQNYVTIKTGDAYISHTIFTGADNETWVEPRRYTLNNVMVESDPPGADIYVDGFATGLTTPYLVKNLSDMDHRIMVSKPGYYPLESTILITGTDQYRRFVLEPYLNGRLSVVSTPTGGKIYINGKDTGQKTPYTFQYMNVGSYSVKVVLNKTKATAEDFIVQPDMTNEINLILESKK